MEAESGNTTLFDREGRVLASGASDASPRALLERLVDEGITLEGADLTRLLRDWPGAYTLAGAVLNGADLRGCQGSGICLRNASLRGAILRNAVLRAVDFTQADLSGAILDGAGLPGAVLKRALLGPLPQAAGAAARHILRPEADEFVPFHRCLIRTADLSRADLRGASILYAELSSAELSGADLRGARIERTTFQGADLEGARFDAALVFRCLLSSPNLHEVTAEGAVFRSNIYMELPALPQILLAGWRFPMQLFRYLREEARQRKMLPRAIRTDLDRMLGMRLFVLLSIPLAVTLAWRSIETAPGVSTVLAFGAVSVFAARRYVTMALQAVIVTILGRLNDADGALRAGRPGAALAVLFLPGMASHRIMPHLPEDDEEPPTA
ncbi:MAG: pentapeptide repeat-containing protein [Pseudomonadota bacterium]